MSNIYDMTYLMHGCLESDTRHLDRAVVGLIHFIVFGAVQHFFGSRVAKEYTEFRCMGLSKSIEVSNIPIVEDCHSPGFDVGITFGQSIHSGTFISGCYRGVRFAEISHFQIVEPLRRDRLSVSGGELVNLSIRRNILRLVFRSVFASFLYMASRSFPGVTEFDLSNYWLVIFQLQQSEVADPQPGPLILMKLVDGSLQRLTGVFVGRFPRLLSQGSLTRITCLGFSKCVACDLYGISCSVSRPLRNTSLPNSNSNSASRGEHQSCSEPRQEPIRYDLLTGELVLLIFTCLAGCLFCTSRFIKYDRAGFRVEGAMYVILFLIGQGAVYLLCSRIYGL